ncbi:hypothetical protein IWQ61_001162 [Dispira simplex]|nr:hypothetical protein IWQ61_001162 [Dispira simplex]
METPVTPVTRLLERNKVWAQTLLAKEPALVQELAVTQKPKVLWIGCSDSRVCPELLTNSHLGEVFVYRNIANVVNSQDIGTMAYLEYALMNLKVDHVVVVGHTGCGGIKGSLNVESPGVYLKPYLESIANLYAHNESHFAGLGSEEARLRRLAELNAIRSLRTIQESLVYQRAIQVNPRIQLHAWIYDIPSLTLTPLDTKDEIYQSLTII